MMRFNLLFLSLAVSFMLCTSSYGQQPIVGTAPVYSQPQSMWANTRDFLGATKEILVVGGLVVAGTYLYNRFFNWRKALTATEKKLSSDIKTTKEELTQKIEKSKQELIDELKSLERRFTQMLTLRFNYTNAQINAIKQRIEQLSKIINELGKEQRFTNRFITAGKDVRKELRKLRRLERQKETEQIKSQMREIERQIAQLESAHDSAPSSPSDDKEDAETAQDSTALVRYQPQDAMGIGFLFSAHTVQLVGRNQPRPQTPQLGRPQTPQQLQQFVAKWRAQGAGRNSSLGISPLALRSLPMQTNAGQTT